MKSRLIAKYYHYCRKVMFDNLFSAKSVFHQQKLVLLSVFRSLEAKNLGILVLGIKKMTRELRNFLLDSTILSSINQFRLVALNYIDLKAYVVLMSFSLKK